MTYRPEDTELSDSMKSFLNDYCYAGKCWVCGALLKEKGATVCKGPHNPDWKLKIRATNGDCKNE